MSRSERRDFVTIICCAGVMAFLLWAVSTVRVDGAQGKASWMPERFGANYLALPGGPGIRVTICGQRCLVMTSTDAGPSKAMQRAGRIADIGVRSWEYICGVPRSVGLCPIMVTPARALPSTDTEPVRRVSRPWRWAV
jgi:hypothetical protein